MVGIYFSLSFQQLNPNGGPLGSLQNFIPLRAQTTLTDIEVFHFSL